MDDSEKKKWYTLEELWVSLFGDVSNVNYDIALKKLYKLMLKELYIFEILTSDHTLQNLLTVLMVNTPKKITKLNFVKYLDYFLHGLQYTRTSKHFSLSTIAKWTTLVMELEGFYLSYETPNDLADCQYVIRLGSVSPFVFAYKEADNEQKLKIHVNVGMNNLFEVTKTIKNREPANLITQILESIKSLNKCPQYDHYGKTY